MLFVYRDHILKYFLKVVFGENRNKKKTTSATRISLIDFIEWASSHLKGCWLWDVSDLNQVLWAGWHLAVPLRQSQGHIGKELIHSDVDLWGEVCREVQGKDQDDVVAQDL